MRKLILILLFAAVPAFAQDDAPPLLAQYPSDANLPPCNGPYDPRTCRNGATVRGFKKPGQVQSRGNGMGREMTPEEVKAYNKWHDSGFKGPHPIKGTVYDDAQQIVRAQDGTDWSNPPVVTIVCFGVAAMAIVLTFITLAQIRNLQKGKGE